MQQRHQFYIDGRWQRSADANDTATLTDPATEQPIATVALASRADADLAVDAARAALDGAWGEASPSQRSRLLHGIADRYERIADHMAALICTEMGAPIAFCRGPKVTEPIAILRYYAELTLHYPWQTEYTGMGGPIRLHREPKGVALAVTTWNDPQWAIMTKLAPAIAAGCAVIIKPATETALDAYALASLLEDAGLPPGVVNILPADTEVSEYLVRHRGVDHVAFTGSVGTGRAVATACAQALKSCTLELGGKNAAIVLDDADLGQTVAGIRDAALFNNGQACISSSRILLPEHRADEFTAALTAMIDALDVGDPTDETTDIGPVATLSQRDRLLAYLDTGLHEGANIAAGGPDMPLPETGYFFPPTLFTDVAATTTLARAELFGPVLTVETYSEPNQAIALANTSDYGLAATVWTTDPERGRDVARHLDTGLVGVGTLRIDPAAPFGGRGLSGIGAELGSAGLDTYLAYRTVVM